MLLVKSVNTQVFKKLMLLVPLVIMLMHLTFYTFNTFKVNFPLFFLLFASVYLTIKIKFKKIHIVLLIILLLYPFVSFSYVFSEKEFFLSYFQYIYLVIVITIALNIKTYDVALINKSIKIFIYCACGVGVLVSLQFVFLNLLHSSLLMNPFGSLSPLGPGGSVYSPHELAIIKRPNGFFSEPSIAGWYLTLGLSLNLYLILRGFKEKKFFASCFIILIGSILTFSLSAIINTVLIASYFLYIKIKKNQGILFLITFSILLLIVSLQDNFVFNYIFQRIEEINTRGSSTYFRVYAPIQLFSESLYELPLGYPLGNVNYLEDKQYMKNWESGSNTNIDNSFFFLIFHFGYLGLLVTVYVLYNLFRALSKKHKHGIIFLSVFLILCETGSLWSMEIILILLYTIIIYNSHTKHELKYGKI